MHGITRSATLSVLAMLLWAPAAASAISNADILGKVNAQRTANGLGAVTESSVWSHRCVLHTHYEALNHYLGHEEDPLKPGYSTDGALGGKWSSQSQGSDWADGNPWENAPWHLQFILSPYQAEYGFAQNEGFNCMGSGDGDLPLRPDPSRDEFFFYGYSPTGGTVPSKQTAFEAPTTPQTYVGIPNGTATGPNLMVWAWSLGQDEPLASGGSDPLAYLDSATLTGPSGPVDVRVVNHDNDPLIFTPFGFVIPVRPLTPGQSYTLTATFSSINHDRTAAYRKTFTTDDRWLYQIKYQHGPPAPAPPKAGPLLSAAINKTYRWQHTARRGLPITLTAAVPLRRVEVFAAVGRLLVVKRSLWLNLPAGKRTVYLKLYPPAVRFVLNRGHGRVSLTVYAGGIPFKTTLTR
jgi:hypothetical protein